MFYRNIKETFKIIEGVIIKKKGKSKRTAFKINLRLQ